MNTSTTSKFLSYCLAFTATLTLVGCSSSGSSAPSNPPPPTPVSVALNQTSANIAVSSTTQFTATVQGSTNTAVTWSVDSVNGGNSTVGSISAAGLYTAPSTPGAHTVTATSEADATKSAKASVGVGLISLSPSTALIAPAGAQQFNATIQGFSNTSVTWSVDNISGGNSAVGLISTSGMYAAPAQPGSHTITATSAASSSVTASATVKVALISVSPTSAIVAPAGSEQFTATLPGSSNSSVTWSVDNVTGGNSTAGTITAAGLYTAPSQPGGHTVTATSVANAAVTASATIAVVTISLSPTTGLLAGSSTQQFTSTIQGSANNSVTWSVDSVVGGSSTAGTISSTGLYTAPTKAGSHTITAAYTADTAITASATISVFAFTVTPAATTVPPSGSQQFTATIQGLTPPTVTWSVDGVAGGNSTTGTISSSGLYSAPSTIGAHKIVATSTADSSATVSAALTVINASQAAVLTYHNDDTRSGAYLEEVTLTPSNVNSTQFGKLLSYSVDGQIYAQPLYMSQVSIADGTHDVVYVVTQNNSVYAFDADGTATQFTTFWHRNLGTSVTKDDVTGVNPVVGILSTPVIDATTNTMYVVAEVSGTVGNQPFQLHALDVTTGADKFGGPVTVTGSVPGTASDGKGGIVTLGSDCYQRMGLALDPVTNAIYIPFGSCNHGWVLAYDKTRLTQTAIFNDTPDGDGGGFWASGGAPAVDDTTGDLYLMSGVDFGDSLNTGYNDSFLRLKATDLSLLDYFTPDDNSILEQNDADLGAGSNVLVPGSSSIPNVTLGGGKDGNVFVVNRDNMGGFNSGSNNVIQTVLICNDGDNNIFSTPVYWNGLVYYHCNNNVLRAYSWNANTVQLSTSPASSATTADFQSHGATASLSANGAINGIIWDIDNSAYDQSNPTASGPLVLHAYDATNVATELYNSSQAGSRDTGGLALKFTVPTISNGRVFVPTGNQLDIYGLLP